MLKACHTTAQNLCILIYLTNYFNDITWLMPQQWQIHHLHICITHSHIFILCLHICYDHYSYYDVICFLVYFCVCVLILNFLIHTATVRHGTFHHIVGIFVWPTNVSVIHVCCIQGLRQITSTCSK